MLPKIMKLFVLGLELGFLQNVYESKCDKDPLEIVWNVKDCIHVVSTNEDGTVSSSGTW